MSAFAAFALDLATHLLSPYQLNPLGLNPLRELLTEVVDFRLIHQQCTIPLVIAATNVRTGRCCLIFREHELTADMVLASTCTTSVGPLMLRHGRSCAIAQPAPSDEGRAKCLGGIDHDCE